MREEEGSTLIENVVALSLFIAVLLPTGLILGSITTSRSEAMRSEALSLARAEVEAALIQLPLRPGSEEKSIGKLVASRTITETGPLAVIAVTISESSSDKPLIVLSAARRIE